MSVSFLPLHFEHIQGMTPHDSQRIEYAALTAPAGAAMVSRTFGLSAWRYGRCIGAGGVNRIWPGRAEAWGIFGAGIGRDILPVARQIKTVLDNYECRRLEMLVRARNIEGHRLAKLLGFGDPEALMIAYHPDGSDVHMYARIRTWQQ